MNCVVHTSLTNVLCSSLSVSQNLSGASFCLRPVPNQTLSDTLSDAVTLCQRGLRFVELRDDLWPDDALVGLAEQLPASQRLLSLRRSRNDAALLVQRVAPTALDFALELGRPPEALFRSSNHAVEGLGAFDNPECVRVVSCHTRTPDQTLAQQLARLARDFGDDFVLKVALPIHDMAELCVGHNWQLEAPDRRIFLPMDVSGGARFRFYRLLRAGSMLLNFVRSPETHEVLDQPTFEEWATRAEIPLPTTTHIPFAAILGDPVEHSRTPTYHRTFFARYGLPVFKVRIVPQDLRDEGLLRTLRDLGLRAAAVTSPLKPWLRTSIDRFGGFGGQWNILDARDPQDAGNTCAVNSIGQFIGATTDGAGLRAAWEVFVQEHKDALGNDPSLPIAVFGGGGLLSLLKTVWPNALFLSARTGRPRELSPSDPTVCAVLVWSVGRNRFVTFPKDLPPPRVVFDLNYATDSPGREYAEKTDARYVDGSLFFEAQADAQQAFWKNLLSDLL